MTSLEGFPLSPKEERSRAISKDYASNLIAYFYNKQVYELPEVNISETIHGDIVSKGRSIARYRNEATEKIVIDAILIDQGFEHMRLIDEGGKGFLSEAFILRETEDGLIEVPL